MVEDFKNFNESLLKNYPETYVALANAVPESTVLSTGVFSIDHMLKGGLPENKFITFTGKEGGTKSAVALKTAAQALKKYPKKGVLWVDAENVFDRRWAAINGIEDLERVTVVRDAAGNTIVDIVQGAMRSGGFSLIVIDSIPALIPQEEDKTSAHDHLYARKAHLCGRLLDKITALFSTVQAAHSKLTVIGINQVRHNMSMFGGEFKQAGGQAVKHMNRATLWFAKKDAKKETVKDSVIKERTVSCEIVCKLEKGICSGEAKTSYHYYKTPDCPQGLSGVSNAEDLLKEAKNLGLVDAPSHGYKTLLLTGERFKTRDALFQYVRDNPLIYQRLYQDIISWVRRAELMTAFPHDGYLGCAKIDDSTIKKQYNLKGDLVYPPEFSNELKKDVQQTKSTKGKKA